MKSHVLRIKKIRFYPRCLFFLLDKWLKQMSKQGWYLVNYNLLVYEFEKKTPCEKEYFSYTCDWIGEGKYSISLRYPLLQQTYGVKKKKSMLNRNYRFQGTTILEIDTQKIDVEKDPGYHELIHDRNRLYTMYTLRNVALLAVLVAIVLLGRLFK